MKSLKRSAIRLRGCSQSALNGRRKSTCTILTCFSRMAAFASSASTNGLQNTEVCSALSPMAGFGSLGFTASSEDLKVTEISFIITTYKKVQVYLRIAVTLTFLPHFLLLYRWKTMNRNLTRRSSLSPTKIYRNILFYRKNQFCLQYYD